jgi:hypothetical protein
MRTRIVGAAVLAASLAAACSSDPDADPAPTTTAVAPDSAPQSSAPDPPTSVPPDSPTTSSTAPSTTTTVPVPTTASPDQVKAEVAAAYLDLDAKLVQLLMHPTLDGLDVKAAEIAVPGSPYYTALVDRVSTLVAKGQFAARNTPDIQSVTVESVDLLGGVPGQEATAIACEVSNLLTMTGPDNPVVPGSSIPVGGTGELVAYRLTQRLQRTASGWRHVGAPDATNSYWPGVESCPPA